MLRIVILLIITIVLFLLASCWSKPDLCAGPLGPPIEDPSSLATCCESEAGRAHCLPAAGVPEGLRGFLDTCSDGAACVPDKMLASGGAIPPKSCTAFGGAGVCVSRCIPLVAKNAALLRQDVCEDPDELCAPCTDPRDGTPTGACDLIEMARCVAEDDVVAQCDDPATCDYEAGCPAVIDPATLPACAPDAHCVDGAAVMAAAPEVAGSLAACSDPSKLCVPDVFLITGNKLTPATCTSVDGAEGRCLSRALPDVAARGDFVPQDICSAAERCMPCFDPVGGAPTGACTLSCDPGPTKPPHTFAACCESRARCVPASSIADADEDSLDQDSCASTHLCVPNEILAGGPFPACTATSVVLGDYTGVCLSDCLDFGAQGFALSRGSCSAGFTCAPCERFGQPTGAPGC